MNGCCWKEQSTSCWRFWRITEGVPMHCIRLKFMDILLRIEYVMESALLIYRIGVCTLFMICVHSLSMRRLSGRFACVAVSGFLWNWMQRVWGCGLFSRPRVGICGHSFFCISSSYRCLNWWEAVELNICCVVCLSLIFGRCQYCHLRIECLGISHCILLNFTPIEFPYCFEFADCVFFSLFVCCQCSLL